jgi:hypothetical protein
VLLNILIDPPKPDIHRTELKSLGLSRLRKKRPYRESAFYGYPEEKNTFRRIPFYMFAKNSIFDQQASQPRM